MQQFVPTQSASCSSAAQHCVGADGIEAIGENSSLSAAAQLHRSAASAIGCGRSWKVLVIAQNQRTLKAIVGAVC